jgi:hopanoid biosynthesis associated protein HpnK
MRPIIITADDFGLDPAVNAAVEIAHSQGCLSAASLMMGGPAVDEAVAIARRLPTLSVGLHVSVVQAAPVLPADAIPALVGPDGQLKPGLLRPSLDWAFGKRARQQLAAEVAAQFAAFAGTGLPLDHVTVHNHLHLHPLLADIIVAQAQRFGRPPVRLPREPWAMAALPGVTWVDRLTGAAMSAGAAVLAGTLRRAGLPHPDALGGLSISGAVTEDRLRTLIDRVPATGVVELHAHPATHMPPALQKAWPGYAGPVELSALCSPAVRDALMTKGLQPVGFRAALGA